MNKFLRFFMLLVLAGVLVGAPAAEAGVVSELLKGLAKAGKYVKSTLDDAIKQSPVMARLVEQYGDDAVMILTRNPERMRLVENLGDDAAEALLKHANIAESGLRLCPDVEVASALKGMSSESGQYLFMCASKNKLLPQDYKNVVLIIKEKGDDAARTLASMKPDRLQKVLQAAQIGGIAVAATMVADAAVESESLEDLLSNLWSKLVWLWEHPILALLIVALIVVVIARFPEIALKCLLLVPGLVCSAVKFMKRLPEYMKSRHS